MCGIVGCVSKKTVDFDKMVYAIKHRGPDGFGISHFFTSSNFNIYLGHTRLSIIDVTDNSSQPFTSVNSKNTIVFNGEIYNFNELKTKYLADFKFKSSGDTEVILELYNKYGTESFKWLKGMFAFSIYDFDKSKILLCRDGLGIKPIYYYVDDNILLFSSEIAALKTQNLEMSVCPNALTEFFLNGFVYEPNTGFKNIKKVFPGSYLDFSVSDSISVVENIYWKPSIDCDLTKKEGNIISLIKKEYQSHLVSDVPLGLFFSGGIDSSLLLMLGNKEVVPYFINSKSEIKESSEFKYAKKVAKSLGRNFEVIDLINNKSQIEKLISSINHVALRSEELMADYTFYVSELISHKARDTDKKVMLSGIGADEIFLGYPRYFLVKHERFFRIINIIGNKFLSRSRLFSQKFNRFRSFFEKKDFVLKYTNLIGYFQENELNEMIVNYDSVTLDKYKLKLNSLLIGYSGLSNVKRAQVLDLYGFLSHNFTVADKSSMQASVEIRVPLATPDLFQYCLNINDDELLKFRNPKIPLLSILREKIDLKLFKRSKEGFNPDLKNIIEIIGLVNIAGLLDCEKLFTYVKKDFINNLICEHGLGKKNHSYRLYQLLYFKFWLDHHIL